MIADSPRQPLASAAGTTETYTVFDPDYLKDAANALEKLVRASCAPLARRSKYTAIRNRKEIQRDGWWAHKGSNLGPLPCEGNALPLSYAPGNDGARRAETLGRSTPPVRARDLRSRGYQCQAIKPRSCRLGQK